MKFWKRALAIYIYENALVFSQSEGRNVFMYIIIINFIIVELYYTALKALQILASSTQVDSNESVLTVSLPNRSCDGVFHRTSFKKLIR